LTCLVAIKNKRGKIIVGADRRVSWGSSHYQESVYAKVRKDDGIIMAFCGDCHIGNLIVNIMKRPQVITDHKAYMYQILPKSIKKILLNQDIRTDKELVIPENTEIIVAIEGCLYQLELVRTEDIKGLVKVDQLSIPYCTGSGGHVAWGSLLTTENLDMSSRERVRLAIEVSSRVVHSVDSKIDICVED